MESCSRPAFARRSLITGLLAAGAGVGALAPGRAHAAERSVIVDCATWGARPPTVDPLVLDAPPLGIVVHHTATVNTKDVSRARAFTLARAIQTHHMDNLGWADSGQHFTISRGAVVLEGRQGSLAALRDGSSMVRGAHCTGHNDTSIGIETEGTYTSTEPLPLQYRALVDLCARICLQYGLEASEINGHRDFNATQCPGNSLYALLPRLREDTADAARSRRARTR